MLLKAYLESICLNLVNSKFLLMKILLPIILIFSGIHLTDLVNEPMPVICFQEKSIHPKDLPQNIRRYVTDNYNGAQITKATQNESSESDEKYSVLINFRQKEIILKFNSKGDFVRKE